MLTLAKVENAFQPAKEVTDAERFAGRKDAVSDAYLGLLSEGTSIGIVGNRGVGKTSLARQVLNIASGDNSLLERLEVPRDDELDFLPIYYACGNSVTTVPHLLTRLLTAKNCLCDWIYDVPQAVSAVKGLAPKIGLNLLGANFEVGGESSAEVSKAAAVKEHEIESVFLNVCLAIAEAGIAKSGILIVIDEFDQIKDPTGAAGLLKSFATNAPSVRFCIVGVAQDFQNLLKEHESADRLFAGSIIRLPPMRNSELSEIVSIAEAELGNAIVFEDDATSRLVGLAQGHPYMVHLVGKYALRAAFVENRDLVTASDVDKALASIAAREADPVLEGRYKKAVGSSSPREVVLKALVDVMSTDGECWTTDAYKIAIERGVDNPSQYVGTLVTEDYGAEIEKVRDRYYRFKDSLFATYVRARPTLYSMPPGE